MIGRRSNSCCNDENVRVSRNTDLPEQRLQLSKKKQHIFMRISLKILFSKNKLRLILKKMLFLSTICSWPCIEAKEKADDQCYTT